MVFPMIDFLLSAWVYITDYSEVRHFFAFFQACTCIDFVLIRAVLQGTCLYCPTS